MNIYLLLCLVPSIVCAFVVWACCRVGAQWERGNE